MSTPSYILGFLIACLSYLLYENYVNVHTSFVKKPDKRYDYIIVGGGTAGCVLAARLSEDPHTKVLLLEAGDQMPFFTSIPLTATAAQLSPYDWSVKTEPQKYSSFGFINQRQFIPRGKGLGGSGQINFLMHGFGLPKDFQEWEDLGLSDWSFDALKPYFKKAFGTSKSEFQSRFCKRGEECLEYKVPMKLQKLDSQNELLNVFKAASDREKNTTFRIPTATVSQGKRLSTLDAYLKPTLKRKNLHILLKTSGVSIRIENNMASSLYILQNGRLFNNIFVGKEIILSAGAIKTPHILMLSGIGPLEVLERNKIKPVLVNEAVGKNLHDHMNVPIYVSIKKPISVNLAKVFSFHTIWDYLWNNKGLLSFPPLAGIEYIEHAALMLFAMGTSSEGLLREVSNYKTKSFREIFRHHNSSSTKEGFMFLASCAKPNSRGYISLRTIDAFEQPLVDPRYLSDGRDVLCIIKAMRRAEQLLRTPEFREIGSEIHWPAPERCLTYWSPHKRQPHKHKHKRWNNKDSPPDEYLECMIREAAVTGHHVGGTCAATKVVDHMFRLKGISRVRIVDASVIPTPVSLYPNSILIGLAERAAELIKSSNIENVNKNIL